MTAVAIATTAVSIAATATVIAVTGRASVGPAKVRTTSKRRRRNNDGDVTASRRSAPAVLPPPQKLPILRRQCAEDRLQGRQAVAAVRVRARQDPPKPHHRRLGEETARARASDQASAVSWVAPLRDPLSKE